MGIMAVPPSVGARFRQRKISVKQTLQILRQNEVPDLDKEDQQRELQHVETGVEKNEETEVHLQRIMKNNFGAGNGTEKNKREKESTRVRKGDKNEGKQQPNDKEKEKDKSKESSSVPIVEHKSGNENKFFIPTPDASKLWKDAKKYYTGRYKLPENYLKTSATVEDTCGVVYCMDEDDEEFLNALNKDAKANSKSFLNEDEFEIIVDFYERTVSEKQPFITVDPTEILSFEQLCEYANVVDKTSDESLRQTLQKETENDEFITMLDPENYRELKKKNRGLNELLSKFGAKVYEHWKKRRIAKEGKPIAPQLKFEDPSDKNNDDDPYICFRRREFRQQRKTRKTDLQSAEKLRKLHLELKSVKLLVSLVAQRESKRKASLRLEKDVFEDRCKVKELKRELQIEGEEEDLVQHKKKKVAIPLPALSTTIVKEEENDEESLRETGGKSKKSHKTQKSSSSVPASATTINGVAGDHNKKHNLTSQPYVKLPASKIPDIELESVTQLLMKKNKSIENAVNEKLRQRNLLENNEDHINITDDATNPFFTISSPDIAMKDYSHLPYSSIVSSLYEVKTSHFYDDEMKRTMTSAELLSEKISMFDGATNAKINDEDIGSMRLINANDASAIEMKDKLIEKYIKPEIYDPYVNDDKINVSEPVFRLRKRISRNGRVLIDRRGLIKKSDFSLSDFINFDAVDDSDSDSSKSISAGNELELLTKKIESEKSCNVYDSEVDSYIRMDSRWRFDNDFSEAMQAEYDPLSSDPSKLNCISNDTQSIRFGSMLLSKAYESYKEAQIQRRQLILQNRRRLQLLQQQQQSQRLKQVQQIQKQRQNKEIASQSLQQTSSNNGSVSGTPQKRQQQSQPQPPPPQTTQTHNQSPQVASS